MSPEVEERLFSEAMDGVHPMVRDNCAERVFRVHPSAKTSAGEIPEDEERKALTDLTNLVQYGTGFNILDTPEYIEGTGYGIHPDIARSLHEGKFSIQAHLDLHGLNTQNAKTVLEKFLKWAVLTGKRGILVIHGRGLASPAEPVLKTKVIEWLTHGPWRKWVTAYASARLYDGGAGATYVLLRGRPASRKKRAPRGLAIRAGKKQ
jgi:DNA-nicking Smr family endonuclease